MINISGHPILAGIASAFPAEEAFREMSANNRPMVEE